MMTEVLVGVLTGVAVPVAVGLLARYFNSRSPVKYQDCFTVGVQCSKCGHRGGYVVYSTVLEESKS